MTLCSGYMPPEYVKHGHFSIKSDVFSFGVLVLEIVSGRKRSFRDGEEVEDLLTYVSIIVIFFGITRIRTYDLIQSSIISCHWHNPGGLSMIVVYLVGQALFFLLGLG